MKEIIEKYKDIIVQIATPHGSGTGFYLKEYDLIVTNNHVIEGSKEATLDGKGFEKFISPVIYNDPYFDLAFIRAPENVDLPTVHVKAGEEFKEGDTVIAIGHPYGLKYTATQGIISKALRLHNNKHYIQTDSAINPGNSGGPLVNEAGDIIGVNTFIIAGGNNLGFALHGHYLVDALNEYKNYAGLAAVRCHNCQNMVTEETIDGEYCPFCGTKLQVFGLNKDEYVPVGTAKMIEDILKNLKKNVRLSRRGKNFWEINEGSAKINVSYSEKNGFIISDAHLARIPKDGIKDIYEFLLRENDKLEHLTFSVNKQDIVLSSIIYEKYLNEQTASTILEKQFERADHYDNILVEQFGAIWKESEE